MCNYEECLEGVRFTAVPGSSIEVVSFAPASPSMLIKDARSNEHLHFPASDLLALLRAARDNEFARRFL